MNIKKGFTLVELLAVITILAVIMLIAAVAILPTTQRSKIQSLADEGKTLVKSAEIAYADNPNMMDKDNVCISLQYLYENGYYEKGYIDGYEGSVFFYKDGNRTLKKYVITNSDGGIGTSKMQNYQSNSYDYSTNKISNASTCLINGIASSSDYVGKEVNTNGSIVAGVNYVAFYNSAIIPVNSNGDLEKPTNATDYLKYLANNNSDVLAYDNTKDNNLRYIGTNPDNYVTFNNQLWRIIGVFNNVEDGKGNKETRIKIIKSTDIGEYEFYDSSDYGPEGIVYHNDWGGNTSNIKNSFVNQYINSISTKDLIDNAVYYLGGYEGTDTTSKYYYNNMNASAWYEAERNFKAYYTSSIKWIGSFALMYPSDLAFATGANNRSTCLSNSIVNWDNNCATSNWLKYASGWGLTPQNEDSSYVVGFNNGNINCSYYLVDEGLDVYPVVFLKSTVKITGGTGTSTNSYKLAV